MTMTSFRKALPETRTMSTCCYIHGPPLKQQQTTIIPKTKEKQNKIPKQNKDQQQQKQQNTRVATKGRLTIL